MTWKKTGGEGLWTEYENEDTGEKSLKTHKPKLVKQWCAKGKHKYIITDIKKRIAVCELCDAEKGFVVGIHPIDGNSVIID